LSKKTIKGKYNIVANNFEIDREIVKNALDKTSPEELVRIFGDRDDYNLPKGMNIEYLSKKAIWKYNNNEFFYLKARETVAYDDLKAFYTTNTRNALRFNFNKKFGINPYKQFNDYDLKRFEKTSYNQSLHMPLDQNLFDRIMSAEKFPLPISDSRCRNAIEQSKFTKYYACEIDGQVLPIAIVTRKPEGVEPHSISVFLLIKGRIPFFVSRLDFKRGHTHPNKLTNNLNLKREKNAARGTHLHLYNEKYSVLFPTKNAIMHAEAKEVNFLKTFEQAEEYVLSQFNFKNHEHVTLNTFFNFTLNDEKKVIESSTPPKTETSYIDDLEFNL
jgi:hypothetical protein